MNIVNCVWELENLGCRVAEVSIEKGENIDKDGILKLDEGFDYIVVKIPSGNVEAYRDIAGLGYYFVENQISLSKKYRDFKIENSLVKSYLDAMEVKPVETENELGSLLEKITPNMFSTDRIHLDPCFGPEYGLRRYKNWVRSEFLKGTKIDKIFYDGEDVGFNFNKMGEDNILHGALGGIYEAYQSEGIGLVLPLCNYWLVSKGLSFRTYKTKVSSNNLPVVQLYNYLRYEQTSFEYVFVKHVNR